jgi:type IV pilus assembly protein PilX
MIKKKFQSAQRGIVLVAGLFFLLILTIIGISGLGSSSLTERMTQNMRDSFSSFEAAEAALGNGEAWVQSQTSAPIPVATCSTAPCPVWEFNALGTFWTQPDSWWSANAVHFASTIVGAYLQPNFIIEEYSFVPYQLSPDAESKGQGYYYYRITARGTGVTDTAHSVVQSMYATQFN